LSIAGEQKKRAIFIGIDKYKDDTIPKLSGAENDAKEIYERFVNNGDFEVSNNHLLIGQNATRTNIMKAISELFRRNINCNLVSFYFSGHGVVDDNNDGYIAPYDLDTSDPFINGIKMEDIRNTISRSKNEANVITFLDCCYAGIATNDQKKNIAVLESPTKLKFDKQLENFVKPFDQMNDSLEGIRGKMILASSEADEVSREKNNCTHQNDDKPHSHGVFSYHLIEGLDGKAADPENGLITIGGLKKYIDEQMEKENKQKPLYYVEAASQIENTKLAISRKEFTAKITDLLEEIDKCYNVKYENSDLNNVQFLIKMARTIEELENIDPNNNEIPSLKSNLNNTMVKFNEPISNWLNNNYENISENNPMLYETFWSFIDTKYEDLIKLDQKDRRIIMAFCFEVAKNSVLKNEKDLKIFMAKVR
jgi:uncharacterized caspase-like protein